MNIYAMVLAGGNGQRMGAKGNKVFLPLRGIPAIIRSIVPFSALCKGIVLVAQNEEVETMRETLRSFCVENLVQSIVAGGQDRQASVASGLAALPADAEMVLVHDGARALLTEQVVRNVIRSVQAHGSGIASVPVTDTIKRASKDGQVQETLNREDLCAMQTPQGFLVPLLKAAHEKAEQTGFRGTDDAAVLEHAGMPVWLCEGDRENLKLTTPLDLTLAEMILQRRAQEEAEA